MPIGKTAQATVLGIPNERFFPFYGSGPLGLEFEAALSRMRQANGLAPDAPVAQVPLLAVSGGGEDGAFGAGLLCGWSEQGPAPPSNWSPASAPARSLPRSPISVTAYDPQLRAVYTEMTPDRVLAQRGLTAALFDDAMTDNSPLFKTISGYLDEADAGGDRQGL